MVHRGLNLSVSEITHSDLNIWKPTLLFSA